MARPILNIPFRILWKTWSFLAIPGLMFQLLTGWNNGWHLDSVWQSGFHPFDWAFRSLGAALGLWALRFALKHQIKPGLRWYFSGKALILLGKTLQWISAPENMPQLDLPGLISQILSWAIWPLGFLLLLLAIPKKSNHPIQE